MGCLTRCVWESAAGKEGEPADFEFEITFSDSPSPLDPDWKPNGEMLGVRLRSPKDREADALDLFEKVHLYDIYFRTRSSSEAPN
jgi:hypothetical protein